MGKKGGTKHLKRKPAPAFWPIHRKENRWVVKPQAGPHKSAESLPLLIVLRDILGIGRTQRDIDILLSQEKVKVDGVARKDGDFPVGLMDVIEVSALGKAYRLLPVMRKYLGLHEIPKEEREFKLCKIVGKTIVRGGHLQLNLSSGRNILVKVADPRKPAEDVYKTSDLLRVSLPKGEILAHMPFEEGVLALISGGENAGQWGEVVKISDPTVYGSSVTIRNVDGKEIETISDYVFPIGKGEAWIRLPGGSEQ